MTSGAEALLIYPRFAHALPTPTLGDAWETPHGTPGWLADFLLVHQTTLALHYLTPAVSIGMDDRKLARFLRNLENLRNFALERQWFGRVRSELGRLPLESWNGWVTHATQCSHVHAIQTEGFRANIKPHSRLGRACYFFPGDTESSRRKAIANAEIFYRIFSPAPHQEGVILEGKWWCPSMLFARGDAWNAANDVYLRLLRDLIGDFTASPLPNAQKFFLDDEISKPVAWTLFSEALPDIDAVTIDTEAPGLGQQTFEVLGVFHDCMPKDLRKVGRIEACPTPQDPPQGCE